MRSGAVGAVIAAADQDRAGDEHAIGLKHTHAPADQRLGREVHTNNKDGRVAQRGNEADIGHGVRRRRVDQPVVESFGDLAEQYADALAG